jgi:hypothetical protein
VPVSVVVPTPTFLVESIYKAEPPMVSREENRFVELAVVANILVVVAFVVVERVTEVRSVKVFKPEKPLLSVRRVDEAKPERVTQESDPPLQCKLWLLPVQVVRPKPLMFVPNKFVVDAVVANIFVVVAEVPVAFAKVRSWKVEEPVRRRFGKVAAPERVKLPPLALAKKRLVVEAVVV